MKILLAWIGGRGRGEGFDGLASAYIERLAQYAEVEAKGFRSEAAFGEAVERLRARTAPLIVLLDGRGRVFSSEAFADWIGRQRDGGVQNLVFAIGPADGWSEAALGMARPSGMLLSLGAMTLPHELARVVLAEQVYRAFTILAGHPYHRE